MTTPTMPLLRASYKMMIRSRGVIFAIVTSALYIAFFGLIEDLGFGIGDVTIDFFDYVLPGFAVFLMVYQIQDITPCPPSSSSRCKRPPTSGSVWWLRSSCSPSAPWSEAT